MLLPPSAAFWIPRDTNPSFPSPRLPPCLWLAVAPRLVSTPEQKCIGQPEQKYITEPARRPPRTGGFFFRHQAGWDCPSACPG